MAQTSINIQPCKVTASERHNKREKVLSYVRPELSHLNEWYNTLDVHLKSYDARLRKLIKAKTGRACQAKSHPLHEATVVIRADTTIEDIKKLADAMHKRWGFHFVQLAVHKDEGHWKEGIWKPNLHAHMVFDKIDHETGKTIKTTGKDTTEMQDMCAQILGMERGKSSNKKHLNALDFKIKAQEERAASQNKAIALQSILGGLAIHAAKAEQKRIEGITNTLMETGKKRLDEIFDLKQEKEKTAKEVENLRSKLSFSQGAVEARTKRLDSLRSEISGLQGIKDSLNADIDEQITQLNEKQSEAEKAIKAKEEAEKDIKSLKSLEFDLQMQLDVVTGEVVKFEQHRDNLKEEVDTLTQERDKAKSETAAAREQLHDLTANKETAQTWKWAYNELLKLVQPILDAITRLAHFNGRGARFMPGEVVLIDFALGRDEKREERAARFTRWAKEDELHPNLYGDYRYQCAGEEMKKIAQNPAAYYNSLQQNQGRGMGY